jgi:Flp pilus assembly protein TadD
VAPPPPSQETLAKAAYEKGFAAWTSGDLPAAKASWEEAAALAPKVSKMSEALGSVLERLGDVEGAKTAYRAALAADPSDELATGALAILLAQTGSATQADALLADARVKVPRSSRLAVCQAEVRSIGGNSVGAQQLLREILVNDPGDVGAILGVARDHYRSRRWELAWHTVKAILDGEEGLPARDPGNPEALLLRGLVERAQGFRAQAAGDFRQAVTRRPDLVEASLGLGKAQLEAGATADAQATLEKATRYAPASAIAHFYLGVCYRMLNRPDDSKRELDTALKLDPKLAGVH